jgi:hypothetical protein
MPTLPRQILLIAPFSAIIACWHGPPERHASLEGYNSPATHELTIALRSFDVSRPARGLAAFPGGGFAMGLDEGVEVNVCEKATGKFRQIAVVHEAIKSAPNFGTPAVMEWLDTTIRITRYTGGDTIVRLPDGLHVGSGRQSSFDRNVIPECEASLAALRNSQSMPNGEAITP